MAQKLTYDEYKDSLKNGRFLGLRCKDCQAAIAPPKMVCSRCQSTNLEIEELSGEGEIHTFTVVRVAPQGSTAPYIVALARLKEGPLVMGNVEHPKPESVTMDMLMGRKVKVGHKIVEDGITAQEKVALTFEITSG